MNRFDKEHLYVRNFALDYKSHDTYGMEMDISNLRQLPLDKGVKGLFSKIETNILMNRPANKYISKLTSEYGLVTV